MGLGLLLLVLGLEPLDGIWRAVTLEPNESRTFKVKSLEKVTGSTGRCVEESLVPDEPETLALTASCSGVRTTMAWKKDGTRVHVMACAEPDDREPDVLALRKQAQAELKGLKTMTACVRNHRVELWGWALTDAELKRAVAVEKKFGFDKVRNFVELIPAD